MDPGRKRLLVWSEMLGRNLVFYEKDAYAKWYHMRNYFANWHNTPFPGVELRGAPVYDNYPITLPILEYL